MVLISKQSPPVMQVINAFTNIIKMKKKEMHSLGLSVSRSG